MKWTGLTGGIATGKSTAKKLIEGLGCPVIDADLISHQITKQGQEGYQRVLSHFGSDCLKEDGEIDRSILAKKIFSDIKLKEILESALHPLIQQEVQLQKKQYEKAGARICFYDVPLLFEKKLERQFNSVVLIWCDPQTQLQRLMARSNLNESDAKIRINNQIALVEKIKLSDYCIDNSADLNSLKIQTEVLLNKLRK